MSTNSTVSVDVREISMVCCCPIQTRVGSFCTFRSKFRLHCDGNETTGMAAEYRFACRTHLHNVFNSFGNVNDICIYSIRHTTNNSHAHLTRIQYNPITRQTERYVESGIGTNYEQTNYDALSQEPYEQEVDIVNETPLFRFTDPTTDYANLFVTPPSTPDVSIVAPTIPPRLERSNAGPFSPSSVLHRTDSSVPSFMERLNRVSDSFSSTESIIDTVNSTIVDIIRYRGIKLRNIECSDCSICLTNDICSETGGALRCGHTFHNHCMKQWLLRGKFNCPLCRASADVLDILM